MAATRVRLALASLACCLGGVAVLMLVFYPVEALYALWILLAAALELVAVVLARRSLGPDPKGGSWRWLAVTALTVPVALLFLPLCGVALLVFVAPWGD